MSKFGVSYDPFASNIDDCADDRAYWHDFYSADDYLKLPYEAGLPAVEVGRSFTADAYLPKDFRDRLSNALIEKSAIICVTASRRKAFRKHRRRSRENESVTIHQRNANDTSFRSAGLIIQSLANSPFTFFGAETAKSAAIATSEYFRSSAELEPVSEYYGKIQNDNREATKIVFRSLGSAKALLAAVQTGSLRLWPASSLEELQACLRDGDASIKSRLEAIRLLIKSNHAPLVAEIVAEQLNRRDSSSEWQDALVFAAENVHFAPEKRSRIASQLIEIANERRNAIEQRPQVVYSAIRRAASLLSPTKVELLLPFLVSEGSIDTKLIALQSVVRMFGASPPEVRPVNISNRIVALTEKFLDPDILSPGESSAIAESAIVAQAALGDSRLRTAIERLEKLRRGWLTKAIYRSLAELTSRWRNHGVMPNNRAYKITCRALSHLQTLQRKSRT